MGKEGDSIVLDIRGAVGMKTEVPSPVACLREAQGWTTVPRIHTRPRSNELLPVSRATMWPAMSTINGGKTEAGLAGAPRAAQH